MDVLNDTQQNFFPSDEGLLKQPKNICRAALVNKLNYINFSDRTILVNFKHAKYSTTLSLQATPLPCTGERLECVWTVAPDPGTLRSHIFQNLFISTEHTSLLVNPKMVIADEHGISMLLPEVCHEIRTRKMNRHPCHGIQVQFSQNSAMYCGTLLDVNPAALRTQVTSTSQQPFEWLNFALPVHLQLHSGQKLIYSGECSIVRKSCDQSTGFFVLTPVTTCFQRFKPKKFRSSRYILTPSPNMIFLHPLTGKTVNLKVKDISGSGFSVEENMRNSMLFAGLLIPELELQFSHNCHMKCQAQVVHRTCGTGAHDDVVLCGLTILGMEMNDQVSLLSLLQQTEDKHAYIDTAVDMDALWSFFFETGFMYPSKYAYFQSNKGEIKKTYEKLYSNCPSIARHFTYQKNGIILGHMAMVRFYHNSWMIHHHAASKSDSIKAGLLVLKQISGYLNDLYHLHSAHLHYVYYYFRPENKFPNRIFGGFAQQLNDRQGCSLDTFAYFHYRKGAGSSNSIPEPWVLTEIRPKDYAELQSFYGFTSGGLMIEAFDLQSAAPGPDELALEYQRLGFKKKKRLYSLLEADELKAVFIADISDLGLNMANLTNCTTVLILDDTTPRICIESALANIAGEYEQQEMPVLMYPAVYAGINSMPVEKSYNLCIMNLQYTDLFLKYCDDLFHPSRHDPGSEMANALQAAYHA